MILRVHDWSKGKLEIRIYREDQIDEVASETGKTIADIKGHLAKAHDQGSDHVDYLRIDSWRKLWEGDEDG